MTNSVQFSKGDRVVCIKPRTGEPGGKEGTVIEVTVDGGDTFLRVQYDDDSFRGANMFAWRFRHVDKELATLPPVCRKIRQMEKRWLNYQQRKANEMG